MSNEDSLQQAYRYAWSPQSDLPLQDFLNKFKPSMVQNDGTKPWIWVQGAECQKVDNGIKEAKEEAIKLLKEVTDKVESIKNDESIPTRSNKKTGAKSKKEVREEVQGEATEQLKEISTKHGYVGGKWLIFSPADKVDMIWSSIATSLASGPLHETSAYLAKVATSSENETPNAQHLICVYIPDVYDKASVTNVMKILLRNHGVNLSGVKSDLYTTIGLDSKHPSGISSTVWKNSAILSEKEIKDLKDAYFADISSKTFAPSNENTGAAPGPIINEESAVPKASGVKAKTKPKLKKKEEDVFASDDDESSKAQAQKPTSNAKKGSEVKGKAKRGKAEVEDDEEEEEVIPKKTKVAKK